MQSTLTRRNFHRWLIGGACVAAGRSAGALPPPELTVAQHASVFAISHLQGTTAAPGNARPRLTSERRVARRVTGWIMHDLLPDLSGTTLGSRRAQRRLSALINRSLTGLNRALNQQTAGHRHHAPLPGGNLAVLGTTSLVTAPGLTLEEAVSATMTFGGTGYTVAMDRVFSQPVQSGITIQLNYNVPVDPRTNGDTSSFAALIRTSDAPALGILVMAVLSPGLRAPLETAGAGNENATAEALSLTFGYTVSGASMGDRASSGIASPDSYYSVQNVLGVGVPPELAEDLEDLIAGLGGSV